jgi:hypothetical protein
MKRMETLFLAAALLSFSSMAFAETFTIDFEQYPEFTQITNQYSGQYATFTNALQLVAPDYDYFDYPPTSGSGVITNDPSDPIQVNFSAPFWSVWGWYADPNGVTVTAYDGVGDVLDTFDGTPAYGFDSEFYVASSTPIAYVTISDVDGSSDSMTMDDLSYATPEPGSFFLLGSGALGLVGMLRRKLVR